MIFVATTPFSVNAALRTHLIALAKENEVTLCVNRRVYPLVKELEHTVRLQHIDIARKIEPWKDLKALYQLIQYFRKISPVTVHSITPKAGLLAMLAARLSGVQFRFHTFTGQVWATHTGISREILKGIDRLIARCASRVFADGASQCQFLEDEGIVQRGGVSMLGQGSIAGVDLARFRPDPELRKAIRLQTGIEDDVPVFLFVGRIVRDKGVFDLVEAFASLNTRRGLWELWMIGPDEDGLQKSLMAEGERLGARIRWLGPTLEPERYMAAADIFVLPSYREGFSTVIIEAAACGIPTIGTRINGIVDAIVEGSTGYLVNVGDIKELTQAMERIGSDRKVMTDMGQAAKSRAIEKFSSSTVSAAWISFYDSLFNRKV